MRLHWFGERVEARITAAAMLGVHEVAQAAAEHARSNHPWRSETGAEGASVFVTEPRLRDGQVREFWGADSPAIFLEFGTHHMPAFPFLRPAADATYRQLPSAIRRHA